MISSCGKPGSDQSGSGGDTAKGAKSTYTIGMSQCNLGEPWRVQMNAELKAAAEKHPKMKMVFKDAQNDTLKQRAHVEEFVSTGVDLIIISPKEAAPLTEPVAKAVDTTDVLLPFYNQTAGGAAILTSAYDINRDRSVDTTDVLLPFYHQTGDGTALLLLDLSGSANSVPVGAQSQPVPMSPQGLAALFAG